MQHPSTLSNPNPKIKKKLPLRNFLYFLKKIYPKSFLYFGMTPDLIYYHNSSIPLKNFCYFPEKSLAIFPTPSPRKQKSILKNLLIFSPKIIYIFWNKYWPSVKFLIRPLYPKTTGDIDTKLGLVTKIGKISKKMSKNVKMTSYLKIITSLSFSHFFANLDLSGSRILDGF